MITQSKITPLLWLAVFLMLVGCNGKLSLIKDSIRFYNSTVSFPERMLRIENGDTATVSIPKFTKPLLIRYYGPEECSDCALNHMRDNIKLDKYAKDKGYFDFIIVLAPPTEEIDYIIEETVKMRLPVCIYIDTPFYFQSEGNNLLNGAFDLFMIDALGRPVFIGNPLQNRKTEKIFEKISHSIT